MSSNGIKGRTSDLSHWQVKHDDWYARDIVSRFVSDGVVVVHVAVEKCWNELMCVLCLPYFPFVNQQKD